MHDNVDDDVDDDDDDDDDDDVVDVVDDVVVDDDDGVVEMWCVHMCLPVYHIFRNIFTSLSVAIPVDLPKKHCFIATRD